MTTDPAPEVEISGPNSALVYCQGNAPTITLTAMGKPSGGKYDWSIISGSDKIEMSGGGSTVRVRGIKASSSKGDVEVKVTYAIGISSASATHKLTVRKPTKVTREDLIFIKEEIKYGRWVMFTSIRCKKFEARLYDQLGDPLAGVPGRERVRFDIKNSVPKRFVWRPSIGKTVTNRWGYYKDVYMVLVFGKAPENTRIIANQTIIFGGCTGFNQIVFTISNITDSYPMLLQ